MVRKVRVDSVNRAIAVPEDREFLFEYRFGGHEWAITIFAADAAEAKEKIKAVALARYKGEQMMKIKVPGGGFFTRLFGW